MVRHRDLEVLFATDGDSPVRVLAVGWLGWFTLRRGATPERFRVLLGKLCRRPPVATATLGLHPCLLGRCKWRWWFGSRFCAGSCEIIVPGREGIVYHAPALIAHYVRAHRYRPPREFIEAVLALDGADGLRWDAVRRVAGKLCRDDDQSPEAEPSAAPDPAT